VIFDEDLVQYLRAVDRPGLAVAELADDIERKLANRQWTTHCSLPWWRRGCDWIAGPSHDADALFALAAEHMAQAHPSVDMMKERIGVGVRDVSLG
jgi:hypothetical protein